MEELEGRSHQQTHTQSSARNVLCCGFLVIFCLQIKELGLSCFKCCKRWGKSQFWDWLEFKERALNVRWVIFKYEPNFQRQKNIINQPDELHSYRNKLFPGKSLLHVLSSLDWSDTCSDLLFAYVARQLSIWSNYTNRKKINVKSLT